MRKRKPKGERKSRQRVRFWAWKHSAPVRITLYVGQHLYHSSGGATDEGWEYTSHRWHYDGEAVHWEWSSQAQDCDGRIDRSGVLTCPKHDLAAKLSPDAGYNFPLWQEVRNRQRDYAAEAMGY